MIGAIVRVIVDRPIGTCHPNHKDITYLVNYGYIPDVIAPDGEEQDAYILGVDKPVDEFVGRVIAIVHRLDDIEDKWIVAPEGVSFTKDEILSKISFQEKFFKTELIM
jgi:inorganic pyrophosphatase